ncbi:MAG: glycosyltransferase family 2 protein [Myxococcota bacterium]
MRASVSVLVPAFNEAPAIARVVGVARAQPSVTEVVVVDDGSTDDTAKVADEAGARVIRLHHNRGKGVALRRGFAVVRGDFVAVMDGDGQDDPSEIGRLLDAMDEGVAMVIGSRFLGEFEPGAISRTNRLGSLGLTWVINLAFGVRVSDPMAGFRLLRRSALQGLSLRADRYDIEADVLLALLARGEAIREVPVTRSRRQGGTSKLRSFRDGSRILRRIVLRRIGVG